MTQPSESGLSLNIAGQLSASISDLATAIKVDQEHRREIAQCIHPFTIDGIPITLSAGAGTLNQPTLLGPRTGNYWDIHRIGATGFTVGTVNLYLNDKNGDLVLPFAQAGVSTFGKGQLLLQAGTTLVAVAATITGTVTITIAGTEIAAPLIGEYLL